MNLVTKLKQLMCSHVDWNKLPNAIPSVIVYDCPACGKRVVHHAKGGITKGKMQEIEDVISARLSAMADKP